jgi:hypothetical protein
VSTPPPPPPRTYRGAVLGTAGLLGLWPLGDRGGTAGNLAGGSAGRYRGGPARVGALLAGGPDGARHFDGRNDRVAVHAGGIGSPSRLTIELWLKRERTAGARRRVLVTGSRRPLADGFTLYMDGRGRPVLALNGTGRRKASLTGPALKAGRTYELAARYDGRALSLYVNARRRATRRYAGGIAYSRGWTLSFGGPQRAGALSGFAGVLDEIAIYRAALPPATLAEQFQLGTKSR